MQKLIIGMDHGYGFLKTAGNILQSGVREYPVMPPFLQNELYYEDTYYVAGEERMPYLVDKTGSNAHYILTLAGIAQECITRGAGRNVSITLAAGLPLEYYGAQKEAFRNYLLQKRDIKYEFENMVYHVHMEEAYSFTQGYAAIAHEINADTNVVLVDIGTGTLDILPIVNGRPLSTKCKSLPMGISSCIEEVQKSFRRSLGGQIEERILIDVMQGKSVKLGEKYLTVVREGITRYANLVFAELAQHGYRQGFQEFIFCGGGAAVIERYGMYDREMIGFKTDIHANAKGYEFLCKGVKVNRKR